MKKTIKLYLTAFLTATFMLMALLFGLTAFGVNAKAESVDTTTVYSCSSTAFQRLINVEGSGSNRKITFETAITCKNKVRQSAITFFGVGGYKMQNPMDESGKLGIDGLSFCVIGGTSVLVYNTLYNTKAKFSEDFSKFTITLSETDKTKIVIEEVSGGVKITFSTLKAIASETGEITYEEINVQTATVVGFPNEDDTIIPFSFGSIVDSHNYTHLSISSPADSTDQYVFSTDESIISCNTPIYYKDENGNRTIFDGTIELVSAKMPTNANVGEAGFTYDANTGYSVVSYTEKITVTDGMTTLKNITPGEPIEFPKLNYLYSSVGTPRGNVNLKTNTTSWSYLAGMGSYYPGDTTNGVSIDFALSLDDVEKASGDAPFFGICIGPNSDILKPGTTGINGNVFTIWITVTSRCLVFDFYGGGGAWTQRAQNQDFEGKIATTLDEDIRFTLKILKVQGVWDIYIAEYGDDGDGEKLTYAYDPSFNFNNQIGAGFLNNGEGCNVTMYGWSTQGTLALYTYKTKVTVTAPMRFKSSNNKTNATFIGGYDAYGNEIPLYNKQITATGFSYEVDRDNLNYESDSADPNKLAFVSFVTAGGITRTVSNVASKVIFDDGVNLQFGAKSNGYVIYLEPEEVRVFNALTMVEMSDGLTMKSYSTSNVSVINKVAPELMANYGSSITDGTIKNVVVVENIAKNLPIVIAFDKDSYKDLELSQEIKIGDKTLPAYHATVGLTVNLPYILNFYNAAAGGSEFSPNLKSFTARFSVLVKGVKGDWNLTDPSKLKITFNNGAKAAISGDGKTFRFVYEGEGKKDPTTGDRLLHQTVRVEVRMHGYTSQTVYLDENTVGTTQLVVKELDIARLNRYLNEVKELKNSCYISEKDGEDIYTTSSWCTKEAFAKLESALTEAENTPVYSEDELNEVMYNLQKTLVDEFYPNVKNGTLRKAGTAATSKYIACKTVIDMGIYIAPVFIALAAIIVVRRLKKSKFGQDK